MVPSVASTPMCCGKGIVRHDDAFDLCEKSEESGDVHPSVVVNRIDLFCVYVHKVLELSC